MEARNITLGLPYGVRALVDAELWMGCIELRGAERGSDVDVAEMLMSRGQKGGLIRRTRRKPGGSEEDKNRVPVQGCQWWLLKSFLQGCSCPAAPRVILRHPPPPPRLRHRLATETRLTSKISDASTAEHPVNQSVLRSTTAKIPRLCLERYQCVHREHGIASPVSPRARSTFSADICVSPHA